MGHGRFGYPAFTAEADVYMPSKDCRSKFRTMETMLPNGRFLIPHNDGPMAYVAGAINSSRRLIDKILMRTGPVPVFVAGAPFIADNDRYVVGQAKVSS
jgi:hypothetical protein